MCAADHTRNKTIYGSQFGLRFSQQGNSFHFITIVIKCAWLTTSMLDLHMCMCVHTPHRENVIIAHDHAPLGLFAWVKATATTCKGTKLCTCRTDDDAWTGLSCRSYQTSVFFSITYFSTSMAILYGTSFIGHLLWYMGFIILHATAGSHVVR